MAIANDLKYFLSRKSENKFEGSLVVFGTSRSVPFDRRTPEYLRFRSSEHNERLTEISSQNLKHYPMIQSIFEKRPGSFIY